MIKKILKSSMILLALIGIFLSVSNFLPMLYAPTFFGTATQLTPENIWHYYETYGIQGLADRQIEGDLYCVDDSSDCCVHIEY